MALTESLTGDHGMEEVRGSNPLSSTSSTAGQEALPPPDLFSLEAPVGEIWENLSPPTNLAARISASCWAFSMVSLITGTT